MSTHVEQDLPELALGTLEGPARAVAEAHVRECDACAEQLAELTHATGAIAMALAPAAPSAGVWSKLSPSVEGKGRFGIWAEAVAKMFDLSLEAANALLESIDGRDGWMEGPGPGIEVMPVAAGPKLGNSMTTLVRIPAGATLPHHEHAGVEHMFVLQGGFRENDGREIWRGELCVKSVGSEHSLVGLDGPDCIAAATIEG